ncbi:CDC27 family protein [uncultured Mitsuokella sp.]|uniref:tetratricopeptide repeat protein n=1 Tax=uncultured Mitsuokella sp. TaxID=453120 RepID=UPI00260E37B0|nr:CDC27 family protein [uncultured Mitsuokella sp.]
MQNTNTYTPNEMKMRELMEKKQYARALEMLAEIVRQKEVKPEFLYDGAYAYFMLGDYDRAADWVTNTLTYAGMSVKARLLLARICLAKGRTDDAMKLLEFLLTKEAAQLDAAKKNEIRMIGSSLAYRDTARTHRDFPALGAFVLGAPQQAVQAQNMSGAGNAPAGASDAKRLLAKLKQKIEQTQGNLPKGIADPVGTATASVPAAPVSSPAPIAPAAIPAAAQESDGPDAAAQARSILARDIPAREKVRILTQFAGGYYTAHDPACAEAMLAAALRVDVSDWTLRNMALVQADLGNKEKALAFAAQMKRTDFLLLHVLRDV